MLRFSMLTLVGHSYRFVFAHLRVLLAAVWPWLVVVFIASLATSVEVRAGEPGVGVAINLLADLLATCAASVLCHRMVLLGERPEGLRSVRFAGRELRYLLAILLAAAVFVTTLQAFAVLIRLAALGEAGHVFALLAATVVALYLIIRGSLFLPQIAIGEGEFRWDLWHLTRGHAARLAIGSLLVTVPPTLVSELVHRLALALQMHGAVFTGLAVDMAALTAGFIGVLVGAAFFAFAYAALVPGWNSRIAEPMG